MAIVTHSQPGLVGHYNHVPQGLLNTSARQLGGVLSKPTLITLEGEREPPIFISVLLHGNETSGWYALQRLLANHPTLPRSMIIFVGNVAAASAGVRALPDQPDYNRIWRGADGDAGRMADTVKDYLLARPIFAAIDLHNNTGHNPHYAVVTDLDSANLALACEFSDKAVYVEEPDTVLTCVFESHCPTVALEVGPIDNQRSDDRAYEFLERFMRLETIPQQIAEELKLFRSIARVHIPDDISFSFVGDEVPAALELTGGVEAVNFHELDAGTEFGATDLELSRALIVRDKNHRDVTEQFMSLIDGRLRLERAVIPAMYTTDPVVVKQDCLCYFMERMEFVST